VVLLTTPETSPSKFCHESHSPSRDSRLTTFSVSLPALGDVRGAFNLQSSADVSSSCNVFSKLAGTNNVIKGKFQCAGEQAHPGGQGTTVTGSSSSSTSTSKGDASGFNARSAAGFTGLMGVVAAMFGML